MTHGNLAFSIWVNYYLSIEEALKAGDYDWKNGNLTSEHFPPARSGAKIVPLHLASIGREITSEEEVLEELDKQNLQPAVGEELFALGADLRTRELQRHFPIVALGLYWDGPYNCRNVPALLGGNNRRDATMLWIDRTWEEDIRFLAVEKVVKKD